MKKSAKQLKICIQNEQNHVKNLLRKQLLLEAIKQKVEDESYGTWLLFEEPEAKLKHKEEQRVRYKINGRFYASHHIKPPRFKESWFNYAKSWKWAIRKPKVYSTRLNNTEFLERLVQHKLDKWIRKNPCPTETGSLFANQYLPKWESDKQLAEENIRDLVISKYCKLPLIGRFKTGAENTTETIVAKIKDDGETAKYGSINEIPTTSKVIIDAQNTTNKIYAKRSNLICTNLKDHKRLKGRIILPKANNTLIAA